MGRIDRLGFYQPETPFALEMFRRGARPHWAIEKSGRYSESIPEVVGGVLFDSKEKAEKALAIYNGRRLKVIAASVPEAQEKFLNSCPGARVGYVKIGDSYEVGRYHPERANTGKGRLLPGRRKHGSGMGRDKEHKTGDRDPIR